MVSVQPEEAVGCHEILLLLAAISGFCLHVRAPLHSTPMHGCIEDVPYVPSLCCS